MSTPRTSPSASGNSRTQVNRLLALVPYLQARGEVSVDEVAREFGVSAGTIRRDILIAALTGWGQQGDRERTSAAGIDLHLVKPVSSHELDNVLRLLEERAAG